MIRLAPGNFASLTALNVTARQASWYNCTGVLFTYGQLSCDRLKRAGNMSLTRIIPFSFDTGLGGRFHCADAFLAAYSSMSWHLIAT